MNEFSLHTIGVVRSCYKEKFGIPRQAGLSSSATATIELLPPYNQSDFIRELSSFSYIWVIFIFHQHLDSEFKSTVRPPRLGGNKRVGVFASRSPFRPNPVGLSAVKLDDITTENNKVILHIKGADLLDGTPVIDIKPYVGYADSIVNADSSYASLIPEPTLNVIFSDEARQALNDSDEFKKLIIETISYDPRPAYVDDSSKLYGVSLGENNIKWKVVNDTAEIISITSSKLEKK